MNDLFQNTALLVLLIVAIRQRVLIARQRCRIDMLVKRYAHQHIELMFTRLTVAHINFRLKADRPRERAQ